MLSLILTFLHLKITWCVCVCVSRHPRQGFGGLEQDSLKELPQTPSIQRDPELASDGPRSPREGHTAHTLAIKLC